jgi:two-component system, chemotaxis family, chemotaxis protein CheY
MAKILVVDDSAYARRIHRKILESGGHAVVEASSGLGAIESFGLERPDVVLLDLSMEDLGGLQVLEQIRTMEPTARVLVVSADVQRSTTDRVRAAGATGFVAKPVSADNLLASVGSLVNEAGPA